jgi:cell wall-associated NlpC family hydrolase
LTPDSRDFPCRSLPRSARARLAAVSATLAGACFALSGLALAGGDLAGPLGPATAQAQASATASGGVLKKGKRGPRVAALQRKLGVTADGVFGPATKRAVRRYQRRHGLVADGVAGPQTLSSLGLGSGRSSGKRGGRSSRAGGVRALQRALGIPADGRFGPQTERKVRSYQRRHRLTADGVVGPQTRRSLGLGSGPALKRRKGGRSGGGAVRGDSRSLIGRMVAAGNRIARKPYRYGGGHGSFKDSGYDCSGSISYVLHAAGLLRTPLDSTGFMSYGRRGKGRRVTIYANAGHAYMVIDGRRFDTSAHKQTGSRWTSTPRSSAGYVARHPAGL